jgi:inner membrane protein
VWVDGEKSEKGKKVKVRKVEDHQQIVYPADLLAQGTLVPSTRYRGLHKVHVYEWRGSIAGRIDYDMATLPKSPNGEPAKIGEPYLALSIGDVRGLMGTPTLKVDDKTLQLAQGSRLPQLASGLHAAWPQKETLTRGSLRFSLAATLAGTEKLAFVPVGGNNRIDLVSTWAHPKFGGSFLPRTRSVNDKGFQATWEISSLASSAQRQLFAVDAKTPGAIDTVEVVMADPVNVYSQADRAIKYGLLFVLLTFVGFFMFELLKQLPIHPVQYLLVGLGLAIFFLLLVSLSEHMAFVVAYLVASVACIGLLTFYLSHVLRSVKRSLGFGVMLTLLYGALYGLLMSEDNALVLGALLLFVVLAAIMIVTRKVDWYQIGASLPGASKPVAVAVAPSDATPDADR